MIVEVIQEGIIGSVYSVLSVLHYSVLIFLIVFFLKFWREYLEILTISDFKWVTLEIKLPKETYKSPKAMEIALSSLQQSVNPSLYDTYWDGKAGPWFSLELVSMGGKVHFFLRLQKKHRNTVESHIYSQYPGVEIHEVPDYTPRIPYLRDPDRWKLWGTEFELTKDDAYPIKTYIDYGLEKDPVDEVYRVEPMAATLEFLGSLNPGEEVWIQILVMTSRKRFKKKGTWFDKQDWKDEAKELIEKLKKGSKKDDDMKVGSMALSPGERTILEAVERSTSKMGFDCGIRALYIAEKDKFEDSRVVSLAGAFRQYNTLNLNGFKAARPTKFDWWEDLTGSKLTKRKKNIYKAYVDRGYFYWPHDRKPFVLNTEELATIYHFPGQAAEVPTFARIESKKSEPPANLPI